MTFDDLADFIQKKMSMSHIYQPLLIKSLVESGGTATLRQLAYSFLSQDESQLLFYEKRIKEMPLKVLTRHGVVERQGDLVSLTARPLTLEQKARVKMLCEQRLQEFIEKRGLKIWGYRLLEEDPVPDSLRYQVLKASGGCCELCGATKKEQPLDIDHIIPRSRGGKNELANLQVLCARCNQSKSNKDTTDFRKQIEESERNANCPFCDPRRIEMALARNGSVVAIEDKYPVAPGHLLIIPLRHTPSYFTMTTQERHDAEEITRYLKNKIEESDTTVKGFNVGTNAGEVAGQSVLHAHIHLIPRRKGDTDNPKGGVRGVIPRKKVY